MSLTRQPSFSAGELSPDLYGRVDLDHYQIGLRVLRNFFVNYHGGVSSRPGTRFLAEVKDSSRFTRLIPFQFNTEQTYVLEFGHQYMRVYKDGGQVLDNNNNTYEIATPYVESDLAQLKFTQSADVMTIVHPAYEVRELSRTGHSSWSLTKVSFGPSIVAPSNVSASGGGSGGYSYSYVITAVRDDSVGEESLPSFDVTLTGRQLDISGASNAITVTWNSVADARQYYIYKDFGQDGSLSGVYGYVGTAENTTFTDQGSANGIPPDFADTPPKQINVFGSAGEYPGCVNYYQQRLVFSGANNAPQRVNASKSGAYKNFGYSLPQRSNDAIDFTIASNQVNAIRYLVSLNGLLAMTSGGVWLVSPGDNQALTPSTVQAEKQSNHGVANVEPLLVGNNALFVQRQGNKVRNLAYSLESDGFAGSDMSLRSTHLLRNHAITDWTFAEQPYQLVWAVRSDGALLSMAYMPDQQIYGWSRHDTDGKYESIASVAEGDEDAVYVVVRRTIGGTTKRYVERLQSREFIELRDAFCVDSGLSYDGRNTDESVTVELTTSTDWTKDEDMTLTMSGDTFPASPSGNVYVLRDGEDWVRLTVKSRDSDTELTVTPDREVPESLRATATDSWEYAVDELSGLDHLEGKEVATLADGNVQATKTVSSGSITLQSPAAVIHVGLPYECDFQTLPVAGQESLRARHVTVSSVSMLVKDSRGVFAGPGFDRLYEHKQRDAQAGFGPIPALTGMAEIPIDSDWESNGKVAVRQSDPLPLTILSIYPDVKVGGPAVG